MAPRPIIENPRYQGSNKLVGKVALITGGDSGVGAAVAIVFAKEGADVAISYLDEHEDAQRTQVPLAGNPMDRQGQPFEVAPTYVYLASDDSRFVTGQTLHVNGYVLLPFRYAVIQVPRRDPRGWIARFRYKSSLSSKIALARSFVPIFW